MLINSPDRNQTANLWKVIIIQMRDRKKGNPIQKTLHIITAENFRWIKQKHAAAFSLNTVTCCACDMATPWPPSTSGPSWVGVKRYWRLPKTDPNSVPIEEVLLDHPSHCLLPSFWPPLKYDPSLFIWIPNENIILGQNSWWIWSNLLADFRHKLDFWLWSKNM